MRYWMIGAGLVLLGGLGFFGYMQLVKAGVLRYNRWDRRERGALKVGDPAPSVDLVPYAGGTLRLADLWAGKPVLLVFGSCT
jgi:hypothetical protein